MSYVNSSGVSGSAVATEATNETRNVESAADAKVFGLQNRLIGLYQMRLSKVEALAMHVERIADLGQMIADIQKAIASLERDLASKQSELAAELAKKPDADGKGGPDMSRVASLRSAISSIKSQISSKKSQLNSAKSSKRNVENSKHHVEDTIRQVDAQIERTKQDLDRARQEAVAAREQNRRSIEEFEQKMKEFEKNVSDILDPERSKAAKAEQKLRSAVTASQNTINTTGQQLADLFERHAPTNMNVVDALLEQATQALGTPMEPVEVQDDPPAGFNTLLQAARDTVIKGTGEDPGLPTGEADSKELVSEPMVNWEKTNVASVTGGEDISLNNWFLGSRPQMAPTNNNTALGGYNPPAGSGIAPELA